MNDRVLIAVFQRDTDLIHAVSAARGAGLKIRDVYTPYAVHGLDEALGWRPSRLGLVCGLCGLSGAAFMLWFQQWTSAVSWPLNIGGKPWNSVPAFVPIIFEGMVLSAGLGSVFALFLAARLRPGKPTSLIVPRVLDDRFALVIEPTDATFDASEVRDLLRDHDALEIEERVLDDGPPPVDEVQSRRRLNIGLLAVLVLLVATTFLGFRDFSRPNWEVLPDMAHSPAYASGSANPNLPGGATLQPPVPGTVALGRTPIHYEATEADALRAGEELHNPLAADDARVRERGATIYQTYCTPCHGGGGLGDGLVAQHGYPAPPTLVTGDSTKMPDGQLFHVITYGRKNMPPQAGLISPKDAWAVILHIRGLQKAPAPAAATPAPAAAPTAPAPTAAPSPTNTPQPSGAKP